jgi:Na+-driven multidrug efflux pump
MEPKVVLSYCTPFLAGPVFLILPELIRFLLPAYIPAIGSVQTLILSALFVSIATVPMMVCVAMNRQSRVVFLMLISILTNAISSYLFIRFGWGIEGVAVGTGFSFFVFSLSAVGYCLKQFKARAGEYVRFSVLVFFPAFYSIGLLFLSDNVPFHPVLKIIFFFAAYGPAFFLVKNNSGFRKLIGSLPILRAKEQLPLL